VAGEVIAGLAESNGSLPPGGWPTVTFGLTACTPGSAPGPTLGIEYGKAFTLLVASDSLKVLQTIIVFVYAIKTVAHLVYNLWLLTCCQGWKLLWSTWGYSSCTIWREFVLCWSLQWPTPSAFCCDEKTWWFMVFAAVIFLIARLIAIQDVFCPWWPWPWPLTLTFKLFWLREQTCLRCEFGVDSFSHSWHIWFTNKKNKKTYHRQHWKQNLLVCSKKSLRVCVLVAPLCVVNSWIVLCHFVKWLMLK